MLMSLRKRENFVTCGMLLAGLHGRGRLRARRGPQVPRPGRQGGARQGRQRSALSCDSDCCRKTDCHESMPCFQGRFAICLFCIQKKSCQGMLLRNRRKKCHAVLLCNYCNYWVMDYEEACFMHLTPGVVHNVPKAVGV